VRRVIIADTVFFHRPTRTLILQDPCREFRSAPYPRASMIAMPVPSFVARFAGLCDESFGAIQKEAP
jgi:hypothetical protein